MKLGVFGGSFDPVHLGHLLVARAAYEELELDRLFFVPAGRSPFKAGHKLAPSPMRLRLLRLALAGQTWCEIDEQEIRRGQVSYTIDTLRNVVARFPQAKIFYLVGADQLPQLPDWREAGELAKLAEFIVVPRPGQPEAPLPEPFRGKHLTGFPFGISASQIRARIKAGRPIEPLVPSAVAEAIHNNRLYL